MSREILFKAKRKNWRDLPKEEQWVEGYYCKWKQIRRPLCIIEEKEVDCIITWMSDGGMSRYEIDPETICQYTGKTDKNGKRIWENDIVANKWCFVEGKAVVRYGEYKDLHMTETYQCGHLGFYLCHINKKDFMAVRKDMMYFAGKCEVIGNVFDNPELLE